MLDDRISSNVGMVIPPLYHKLPIEKDNLNDDGSAMTGLSNYAGTFLSIVSFEIPAA